MSIGRPDCPDCFGYAMVPDTFGDYMPCHLCCEAAANGMIARAMTVDASRLYAMLCHPAGKRRPR